MTGFLTVREALGQGRDLLERAGIQAPRLNAEILLGQALSVPGSLGFRPDAAWFYAHSDRALREVEWIHYGRYLHQRLAGKPTQYITGRQEFYGREFAVTPDVLIPRPETELLVECALKLGSRSGIAVDVGTGSGAIAITLALEGWSGPVLGIDISARALEIAHRNARKLGAKTGFVHADLLSPFADHTLDAVVSNPPYIAEADRPSLQREVVAHEPGLALFGGTDGYGIYCRLIPQALHALKPGGLLAMEIGIGQAAELSQMLAGWNDIQTFPDLAGIPRVLTARTPANRR